MSDLPENWLEFFTDDGDSTPYYYNTVTGITMWEHPSTLADSEIKDIIDNAETRLSSGNISHEESDLSFLQEVPSPVEDDSKNDYISSSIAQLQQILDQTASNLESNDTEELPENWMLFYTDDDEPRPYYYNILSGETIWEHPNSIQVENENKQQAEEKLHEEEKKIEKLADLYTSIDISLTGALSVHNGRDKTASNTATQNATPVTTATSVASTFATAISAQDATTSVAVAPEATTEVNVAGDSSNSSSTKNPFDEDEDENEVAVHTTITTISAAEANKLNSGDNKNNSAPIVATDSNAVVAVAANVSGKSEPPPLPDAVTSTSTAATETTAVAAAAETARFEGASPVPIGGALPENWLEFFTDDGENTPYYYNEITGDTIWEHPSTLVTTTTPDTATTSTTIVNETNNSTGNSANNVNSSGSINNSGNNNSGVKSGGYSVTTTIASQSFVPADKSNNTSNSNNTKETVTSSKSNSSNPFGDEDEDQAFTSTAVSVPIKNTTMSTTKSGASSSPYNPFASDDHEESILNSGSTHQTTYQTATVYDKNNGKSTTLVKPIVSSAVVVGAKNNNNSSSNNNSNVNGKAKVSSSSNPFGDDDIPTTSNNSKGNSNNSGNNGRPMSLLQKAKSSGIVPKQAPLTSNSNSNSNSNSGTTSPNNPFADDYVPSSNNNNINNRSTGIATQNSYNNNNSNSNNRGIPVAVAVHTNQKPPAPLNRYHSGANSDSNLIPQPPTRSAAGSPLENSTKTNNRYHVGGNAPPPPTSRNNNTTGNSANRQNIPGTRPPPPVVSPLNARGNASAQMMLSANGNNLSAQELSQLSKEMKWLLKIGVKPFTAEAYLKGAHNNAEEALLKINQFLINAVQLDPYDTQLSTWASRISIRVKSWLPNMMENNKPDYHTAYIVTVNFTSMCSTKNIQPWQLTIRYSQFYALHQLISRHLKYTRVNSEFPQCTAGQWFWGITDELRNERMNKFDTWLREVLLNSVLMTNKAVLEAVNVFLEIDSHVNE